jgi:hypothetical protein
MNKIITENGISFWQLISKDKIEIPIIQRDYAQGRDDKKTEKIRNGFLASIIGTLEKENSSLELDFVYGNVERNVLQPLDGQQRLTTLFLLHWYLILETDSLSENKSTLLKFTYETRISSREFCNELVKNGDYLGVGERLSEKISDSKWFFLSWKKDPTIKAMLIMLDAIEEKLKDKNLEELTGFFQKLIAAKPPITFHFKALKDIGLTDDLYIKMNARGVALTDFENFKALFEKHIENNRWESKELKLTERFSHKVDTIWTDMFWKHRGSGNLIDNEFIKFIAGIGINNYAENLDIIENLEEDEKIKKELKKKSSGKSVSNEAVKRERIELRIQNLFNLPDEVSPNDFPTKKAFDYLVSCLDVYSKDTNDEILPTDLLLWDHCKNEKVNINSITNIDNNLFIEFIKSSETTYKQRVLFYIQTQYLLNSDEFNKECFSDWMRVVRNIVLNATIDSPSTFIGAISLTKELSTGVLNIYEYLANNDVKSGFASIQISEEKLKAEIICLKNDFKEVLFKTEDTNFCKGRITFTLDCIELDKNNLESFSAEKLNNIQKVIENQLSGSDITNDFRRGLFTIDDNLFYNYWSTSYLYAVSAPKRCMIENIYDLKNFAYNQNFKKYLIGLLKKLVESDLSSIISNYELPDDMPNWKKRIIKEKNLIDFSHQHYLAIKDDQSRCWLIPESRVANSKEGVDKCKLIK